MSSLPHDGQTVHALEPSAGIGRFLRAFEPVPGITWHAVEWSELSARMLHVLRPDVDLTLAPFERWVREKGAAASGRLGLVVSNPPYGIRGASIAEDPDRVYREKMAYHYFLRRGLDLLAPDGLGVFLVPGGFLTSRTPQFVALREKVLKRHHLAAAYRLPSINEKRREAIFPGAMLVTDLLFFRARGGELDAFDAADEGIVAGGYFKEYPRHILGREVGDDHGIELSTQEFTEKLAAIIPPPRANQTLYAGVLAGNAALRAEVVPRVGTSTEAQRAARAALKRVKAEDRRETSARAEERRCWAELLKRVFEVDGWACPHCDKPMALRTIVIREPATTQVVSGLLRATGPPVAA